MTKNAKRSQPEKIAKSDNLAEDSASAERIKLLLIDDEALTSWAGILDTGLRDHGFELQIEAEAANAIASIKKYMPDVVLLDLHFPEDDLHPDSNVNTTGGRLLVTIRTENPALPVVLFSSLFNDVDIAQERFEIAPHAIFGKHQIEEDLAGRDANWPVVLANTLRSAIELAETENSPAGSLCGEMLVGGSAAMRRAVAVVRQAARNCDPVLIQGESGSGKTTAARTIHTLSTRANQGNFVHLRCSGRDEHTLAAELFGYASAAIPGATIEQAGLIEKAHLGTLYIDEFQLLPHTVQDRLLSVLDTGSVKRLGETSDRPADVRLIIASSHLISDLVDDGIIQDDFAYRIVMFMVTMPPLRERLDDLPELVVHFLQQSNTNRGKNITPVLRPEVLDKLRHHPWRGNLLELRTVIDRAVLTTLNNLLVPDDIQLLPPPSKQSALQETAVEPDPGKAKSPVSVATAPATLSDQAEQLIEEMWRTPVSDRWKMLRGDGKPSKALTKAVLEGIAKRLWNDGRKMRMGAKMNWFLIDMENLESLAESDRASNRVRTLLKEHGVSLTKIDYSK